MNILFRSGVTAALFAIAACSGTGSDTNSVEPAIEVSTVMPLRQTFHTRVAAFGQLAADSRNALSLSLPQAGEIVSTDVIAGQRVQRGAPLLKLATDPATRSAYLQAQSALAVARDDLARTVHLHEGKLATNAQLDTARKTLADAESALAAQAQLGGAQATSVLRAPADGVVTMLDAQRGQRVPAGTTLIQFTPRAALAAQLGVEPEDAAMLHAGMPVAVHPVYAAPGAPPLRGTTAVVGNAVNSQTRLIDVITTLDGRTALPAGTALSASIDAASFTAWSIPRNAVQDDAQGSYLYQIEHGKAHRVDVKVVASDGSPVGVDGALDPGAPVITLGSYEISDGDPVRAAPGASASGMAAAAR